MTNVYSAEVKDAAFFNRVGKNGFPGLVGLEVLDINDRKLKLRLEIKPVHLAPNGMLHAAVILTLADTACGYGSIALLPEGAKGHATIELKCNFVGATNENAIICEAVPLHLGRTTHVWDAGVYSESSGKAIAHFRCTQIILW
jgi:uncharacterized protein (TIGR00369 family)